MFVKKLVLAGVVLASSMAFSSPAVAAVPAPMPDTAEVESAADRSIVSASPISVFTDDDGNIGPADYADCPRNRICVYASTNGGGLPGWTHFGRTSPGSCTLAVVPTLLGLRGYVSAYNRTGVSQRLWTNTNCTGLPTILGNEGIANNLGSAHASIGG